MIPHLLNALTARFRESFGDARKPRLFVSAPGRVELAGNHVDHQGGRVISAGLGLKIYGLAAAHDDPRIRVDMGRFGTAEIDLEEPGWNEPRPEERESSAALIRGMAAAAAAHGRIGGFDLVTVSELPTGGGLSSSAAFEMLIGMTIEGLYGSPLIVSDLPASQRFGAVEATSAEAAAHPEACELRPADPVALALAGVSAERGFFGKLCGAQDQLTSACGGVVAMDFSEARPQAEALSFDAEAIDYALCLIDSRVDHALFTDEFSQIPADMTAVAHALGAQQLGQLDPDRLLSRLEEMRAAFGDLTVMRALHCFDEIERVKLQRQALLEDDFERFLRLARLSGASSAQYLQNVSPRADEDGRAQPAMMILALCSHLLGEQGAWRIHGGGFGGSVLAIVPREGLDAFTGAMDEWLGYEACLPVELNPVGAQGTVLA